MVKSNIKERRRWVRAKRVLSITFKLKKSARAKANKDAFLSTTEDMSVGGLSFYTDCEYQIGDILDMKVVMSGVLDIFGGFAEVVRVEKKKTGAHYLIGVKYLAKSSTSNKTSRSVAKKTTRSSIKKSPRKRV